MKRFWIQLCCFLFHFLISGQNCCRILTRRNFSLDACYSLKLKFIYHSLLVIKTLVTCCKNCSLLLAEFARCKKSLVTRWRSCSLQNNHSLLVAKFARYSLEKLLVAKIHLFLIAKFGHYSLQKCSHFLQFYLKGTLVQVFSCEFFLKFKNTYSVEHLRPAVSETNIQLFHFDLINFDWTVTELFD